MGIRESWLRRVRPDYLAVRLYAVEYILGALDKPNRPLVAIVGGAKGSSKIEILEYLIPKVDILDSNL